MQEQFAPFRDASLYELVTEGLVTTVNERQQDKKKARNRVLQAFA
jgi:hypothetical protein